MELLQFRIRISERFDVNSDNRVLRSRTAQMVSTLSVPQRIRSAKSSQKLSETSPVRESTLARSHLHLLSHPRIPQTRVVQSCVRRRASTLTLTYTSSCAASSLAVVVLISPLPFVISSSTMPRVSCVVSSPFVLLTLPSPGWWCALSSRFDRRTAGV
ncbi:hypothetical protein BC629DRAFT_249378 [Irpex lacteus]|nr:hypothetical protein BC629DRAFT_249378 [Irpex lacteus]